MSIKLNGNQIAGAPGLATTNKAGIVRMASDEEIKQGTSNTAFVTPKQLSSYCGGLELCDIGMALYVDETKGKRRYLNGSTMFIYECYEPFLKRLQEIIALYPNLSTTEENWQAEALLSAHGQVGKFVISESTYYGFASGESVVYTDSIEDGRVKVYTPDFVLLGEGTITSENLAYNLTYTRNNNDKTMTKVRLPKVINVQGLTDLSQAGIRIPAGIPDITASTVSNGAHTHTRGTMEIKGHMNAITDAPIAGRSAIWTTSSGVTSANGIDTAPNTTGRLTFTASKNWTGATSSNGAHTHTVNLTKSSVYGNSETVQPETIQYPYFIQVATGQETTANVKNELQLNNPYSLGDSKYSPVRLNNVSWLKSKGQWNSKAMYPDMYNWLLHEYNTPNAIPKKTNIIPYQYVTNVNNVISNFSATAYALLPAAFAPANKTWEMVFKVQTGSTISGQILGGVSYNNAGVEIGTSSEAHLSYWLGTSTASYDIAGPAVGTSTLNPNTTYYIKVEFTGSQYNMYLSTNGVDYVNDLTINSTLTICSEEKALGIDAWTKASSSVWTGSIDLNESYIKIDGKYWWRGVCNEVRNHYESYDDYCFVINQENETFRLPLLNGEEDQVRVINEEALPNTKGGHENIAGVINLSSSPSYYTPRKNGIINVGISSTDGTDQYFEIVTETYETGCANFTLAGWGRTSVRVRRFTPVQFYYSAGTLKLNQLCFTPFTGNGDLYYYVGETTQNASIINIGRVQEEVSNKLDKASIYYDEGTQTLVIEG